MKSKPAAYEIGAYLRDYLALALGTGDPKLRVNWPRCNHTYLIRLPDVLLSLWDSRIVLRQLKLTYPDSSAPVLATNQLPLCVVFNGDFQC